MPNWRDKTAEDYSSPLKTAGKPTAYQKDGKVTDSTKPDPASAEPAAKPEPPKTKSISPSPGRRRTTGVIIIFVLGAALGVGAGWWLKPEPPHLVDIQKSLAGVSAKLQETQATNANLKDELLKVGKRITDMESWQRRICQKRALGDCD